MIDHFTLNDLRHHWDDVYPHAATRGIICPLCGNGSGEDGTGVDEVKDTPGLLHCFKCGFSGDIFSLYAEENHLDLKSDFREIVKGVADRVGVSVDDCADLDRITLKPSKKESGDVGTGGNRDLRRAPSSVGGSADGAPSVTNDEPDYSDFCAAAAQNIDQTDYLERRGISIETARAFGIGFAKGWFHPDLKRRYGPGKPVLIIPTSPHSYIARDTRLRISDKDKKYTKQNAGKVHVFNERALSENEIVFAVEGAIDALSVAEVGFNNVVAINSATNKNIFIRALQAAEPAPKSIILSLDNDDAGLLNFKKLANAIKKLGIAVVDGSSLPAAYKDANELLVANRELLTSNCKRLLALAADVPRPIADIDPILDESDFKRTTKAVFPTCPFDYKIPPGWSLTGDGVSEVDGKEASLTPVFPAKKLFHQQFKTTKYVLAYLDGEQWRELTVDADVIADHSKTVKLADFGIQTFTGAAKRLVVFFNKFIKLNSDTMPSDIEYTQPGWHNDFADFVLPHYREYYAPSLDDFYTFKGGPDVWIDMAEKLRAETNPIPRIMLDVSFAAPLMPILDIRTFATYLWGTSLSGKSAAQKFALSAWGNPDKMLSTFKSTANGLEAVAVRSNNLPMMIDERQVADQRLDLTALMYFFCGEINKGRMTRTLQSRPNSFWRMPILASGENKLIDREAGTGAFNRVLEIPLEYGEKIFQAVSPSDIHNFVKKYHGCAGRLFIDQLMPHRVENFRNVRDTFDEFYSGLKKFDGTFSSEHVRFVSLICASDFISSLYLFELAHSKDLRRDIPKVKKTIFNIADYIFGKLPTAADLTDARRAWDVIVDWIRGHVNFFRGDHLTDPVNPDKKTQVQNPILGKFDFAGEGADLRLECVLVIPTYFRDELKKRKFPADKCIRDFRALGLIKSDGEGKNPHHTCDNGESKKSRRMIEIPGAIIADFLNLKKLSSENE